MKTKKKTYLFRDQIHGFGADSQFLECPNCGELISRSDIESFPRCPYCDRKLETNRQLEEYILKPAVIEWFQDCIRKFPGSGNF